MGFALLVACAGESDDGARESESREAGRSLESLRTPLEECAARQLENQDWFTQWQTCESDEDCELVKLEAGCLAPFHCPVGLSVHVDRTQLELDALERAATYARDCACAVTECARSGSERAVCDKQTKLCRAARGK